MPPSFRNEFDSALNTLSPVRDLIGDLMALCLEQVEFAPEIVDAIVESILETDCNLNQRLARMYLVSDILYNSTAAPKASRYRGLFDSHLQPMFEKLQKIYSGIESRFVAEQFRTRISTILRAWAAWSLYTTDALVKLNNVFVGLVKSESEHDTEGSDSDVDGMALDTKDASSKKSSSSTDEEDDDVDGIPIIQEQPKKPVGVGTGFVQSKWEAIDEEDIKAEAVTSAEIFAETQRIEAEKRSKEVFDKKEAKPEYLMSTAWRKRIRDVELKVIEYCDHLKVKEESEQAEEYRCTLIRQATKEFKSDSSLWDEKPIEKEAKSKKSKKSKDESRDRKSDRRSRRSRSRSPVRRQTRRSYSRSRSKSRDRSRDRRRKRR